MKSAMSDMFLCTFTISINRAQQGRADVTSVRPTTTFSCCNFLWWRAEEGWGRHLSEIAPRSSLVPLNHPPNYSVLPKFNTGCVKSMMTSTVSNPIKSVAFYSVGFFWKTDCSTSSRTLGTLLCDCFPWGCSGLWPHSFLLSEDSNLDIFPLYGIYF